MVQGPIEQRLYDRCIEDDNGCWNWTGAIVSSYGYGYIYFIDRPRLAHRVSWIITYGDIPEGLCVCHSCDNTRCCNPEHLFLGTYKDNEEDKKSKGRTMAGERQGSSKLTNEQVLDIREKAESGVPVAVLAVKYDIATTTVSKIKLRKRWGHI